MGKRNKLAVLAIGGNSLIRDKDHQRVSDQFEVTRETCRHIREMIEEGWNVVVTHGNGPQVGFLLRRTELSLSELHPVPLDSIGADTQGSIGYMIQQSLRNEFVRAGLSNQVATVITQVQVDPEDEAFKNPSKPIGSFMDEQTAKAHAEKEGWDIKEDAGRGWRRVVASPLPKEIVERDAISALVESGYVVVGVGGGGVPVIRKSNGDLEGVPAVIDKDYASALLASRLDAERFVISTAVDQVYLNFNQPNQNGLDKITVGEASELMKAGHFPAGSMGPKMKACINFLIGGGKEAIVTSPALLAKAMRGEAGTIITRD